MNIDDYSVHSTTTQPYMSRSQESLWKHEPCETGKKCTESSVGSGVVWNDEQNDVEFTSIEGLNSAITIVERETDRQIDERLDESRISRISFDFRDQFYVREN